MSHDPIRVGLIGAGGISHSHISNLLALGADVYVYSEDGAQELVARHGGTVVESVDELHDRVECVDVVTPTHTHAEFVARALAAGKDVISEKPLARTRADAEALAELSAATGRNLYPAHVVRYFPEYVQLQRAVESGLLGELAVLRFSRSGAYPIRTPWFADRALSGGIIMDQMIHDIDVARWVAGEVVRVSAVSRTAGEDGAPVEAAHVLLTHRSGAISHIAGIWGPQHLAFRTEFSVTGTLGTLEHSSDGQRSLVTDLSLAAVGGQALPDIDPAESPYYLELKDFLGAIRGGSAPRITAADGVAAVAIAEAALESLDSGHPVDLEPEGGR